MTTVDVVCYYHDPVKAPLLRGAILPALADGVDGHLERGWLHGPHVRVRLAGDGPAARAAATGLAERIGRYLDAHPSRAGLTRAQLHAASVAAGRSELVPPPYEPLEPDNTVRVESGVTAADRLPGADRTAEVRRTILRAGIPAIAATVLHSGQFDDRSGARVEAAVAALTAHVAAGPWGLGGGYMSYKSHLEAHLHRDDRTGRVRAVHGATWSRLADRITERVEQWADPGCADPLVTAWRGWSARARATATCAHAEGALTFTTWRDMIQRVALFRDPTLMRQYTAPVSRFHKVLGARERSPGEQRRFDVERFGTNMLYLLLAVCDVTPAERYLACGLVSEAAQRLSGRTWWQLAEAWSPNRPWVVFPR